jgi:glycosyltransferase involved in cell wall biosynthesis
LAVLQTHPSQLDGPLFRAIAQTADFDLTVYYLDTDQIGGHVDPELGFSPNWDTSVTSGYSVVGCPQGFLRRLRFLRQECFSGDKYDLVIVPGYARFDLTLLALLFRSQPLGMRLDTAAIYPGSWAKARLKRVILKYLFRRYSAFHPVGSLTECFLQSMGISRSRMFRFAYAADNRSFRTSSEGFRRQRDKLLQGQGIPPEHFVVLGVLKFIPRENPMELLRGFRNFHLRFPDSALLLVGAGALEGQIRTYVSRHGLGDAVRLVGYSKYSDLPKWYAMSDVFVHPSTRECWGASVNEAMACGLAVIASSLVGSSYDLIRDGINGYQYPSGDVEALSGSLERIASLPDRGKQLGECSSLVIKAWDFGATIESLRSALDKVGAESTRLNTRAYNVLAADASEKC